MSSDPLGLAAGVNTYGYVSGNSLKFSDRLGLLVEIWGFGPGHGGFGHLAVRVNERVFAFYPIDKNRDGQVSFGESYYAKGVYKNQSVSDFLYDQAGDLAYVFTLNLSKQQEDLLNNNILEIQKKDRIYSLFSIYNTDQCTSFGTSAVNNIQNKLNIPGWQPKAAINYLLDETAKRNNMIKKFDYGTINMKYRGIQ